MAKRPKRRNPTSPNSKQVSPRRGAKSKQTKVTPAKEMEEKIVRQTKLSFTTQGTEEATSVNATPKSIHLKPSTAITPEGRALAARAPTRLAHPTPPSTPERHQKTPLINNLTTATQPTNNENTPNHTINEDDNDKKPAAKTTPPATNHPEHPTKNHTDNEKPNGKQTKKQKSVRHANHPDTHPNSSRDATQSPDIPLALQKPSKTYKSIRYNGFIEVPPSEQPFQYFLLAMKEYLKIIQDVLGKDVFIAAWDAEQEKAFPPLKRPEKIPSTRESLGIYLGTYVNPKQEGSMVFLNLRLITFKNNPVPMERFGTELADQFASSKHNISIRRNPRSCQAAKSECIGWLMYSCKSMNSVTFVPALKLALKIPEDVEVGIQYRTIANEHGKKPPFDKENPPAAAIHLDIDERYALLYQARAASLWRKNSNKRLPNGVQLRLVPCFTSATGKSMTGPQRSDAQTLLERQYYFVKEHLRILPAYFFISQLDTPLAPDRPMTLRRAMMSRAPANRPSCRLIHNVDASWNQPSKHTITSVVGREQEAQRFLVNMIPEFLHQFGNGASKWFTGEALLVYKEVTWNPKKGTTSSAKERNSEEMVQEDLWELNDQWEKINVTTATTDRPDTRTLDDPTKTKIPTTTEANNELSQDHQRLSSDKSIASFGNVYHRTRDDDDDKEEAARAKEAAAMEVDPTGTQFEFSPAQLESDRQKTLAGPMSTGFSMSTAAKTTNSTRLKLKEAQEEINDLRLELAKQAKSKTADVGSPEDTPEATLADTMQLDSDASTEKMQKDEFTEHQALSAAIHRKREYIHQDKDTTREDGAKPIQIGSSESSDDYSSRTSIRNQEEELNPEREGSQKARPIALGSSSSSSESSSASDTSSSSSSSSSGSSNSTDTQDLAAKISHVTPTKTTITTTKHLAHTDCHDGSPKDSATSQRNGPRSGTEEAHIPPYHPHGIASDLPEAAGPRV